MTRATAGRKWVSRNLLKPSLLFRLEKDLFGVWCDYHAPADERVDETTPYERARMDAGVRFEKDWGAKHYPDEIRIEGYSEQDLRRTIDAMARGVRAILHPQLWALALDTGGQGDAIVRSDDAPSDLGPFHYRVKECKKSASVQHYHKMQGALYTRIIGLMQGYTPSSFEIVLPSGEVTVDMEDSREDLISLMALWKDLRDGSVRPELPAWDSALSPWRVRANRLVKERKDVTILAGYTARVRQKLRDELGVHDLDNLAHVSLADFQRVFDMEAGTKLFMKARAWAEKKPILYPGTSLSLPARERFIYWDIETSDNLHPVHRPHIYLVGLSEKGQYRPFGAKGPTDEERMLEAFLDYVGDPRKVALAHWTGYETSSLERAAERHPRLAGRLRAVGEACVDLYAIVKESVALPTPSYSIKDVAPFFGFHWRQNDIDGRSAMLIYWKYLQDARREPMAKVVAYNADDVRAMEAVVRGIESAGLLVGKAP
jgi:predicted RecB family nuclease